jgi:CheY-like chemotaxis protein
MVSDNGVGIPAHVRPNIFEPFFTTKAPGRGTGLGLAMVASIIKRAGGRVDVTSELGRGTTFTIVLPAADRVAAPAPLSADVRAAPEVVPGATAPSGTVLLVDDDAQVRYASRRMLERAGYGVLEAPDGASALAVAARQHQRIDLLLTDLLMPGVSGRTVIARFREMRPGIPIVCVTGFAAERDDGSTLSLQVNAIVAKPFTMDVLTRALAEALAESRPQG